MQTWTELPAGAASIALAGAVCRDAMTRARGPAELFDVDVDQFAGMLALIAADRLGRFQRREPVEAVPPQHTADGSRRDAELGGDLLACVALPAQSLDGGTRGRRCLAWR